MVVQTRPKVTPAPLPRRELGVLETRRRRVAQVHLFTYIVGNALFWTAWAAISITADHWYWWPVVPFVGWAIVLAAHLWHVYRPPAQSPSR